MSGKYEVSAAMATQICEQIKSVFTSWPPPAAAAATAGLRPPLEVLVEEIQAAGRIFVHGVGREGLMLRALCMRLYHLDLSAHVVGDVTTPPIAPGDLLLASAGPGGFATVDAICRVAKSGGARVALVTAQPWASTEAIRSAEAIAYLPARTMADEEGDVGTLGAVVRLPMGSLYEGAMFVLFEMVVMKLAELLGRTPDQLRLRHTNLE